MGVSGTGAALRRFHDREMAQGPPLQGYECRDGDLYRGDCISFRTEEEFRRFLSDYEGPVFTVPDPKSVIVWCYRDEQAAEGACRSTADASSARQHRRRERRVQGVRMPCSRIEDPHDEIAGEQPAAGHGRN